MTPSLQLTSVTLRVPDLDRSLDFYQRQLGFYLVSRTKQEARLSAAAQSPTLLTLLADSAAAPSAADSAGLFHAAMLLPSRAALSSWLRHAAGAGVEFEGFSDHGVSEAIYLSDPDGNGLEFYADRPRAAWPRRDGQLAMTTLPLDMDSLLAETADVPPTSAPLQGAAWGHLHLRVTDLERSDAFYRSTLGMEVMQRSFPGARFLAADGYHHHLGLNTWGHPRRPHSCTALGLVEATFVLSGLTAEKILQDPDGIHLRVQPLVA
jgi:catechol 2,3-dioxygenase